MSQTLEPFPPYDGAESIITNEADTERPVSPHQPHLNHSRSQSSITTNSEAFRKEWAFVPPPLRLTPKVFQASHFEHQNLQRPARRLKRRVNHQIPALHRSKRVSRLRDVAMADQQDEIAVTVEEEDAESDFEYEDFIHEDAADNQVIQDGISDVDSCSLLGSSIPTSVEPATRYDDGRYVGLPSAPTVPRHGDSDMMASRRSDLSSIHRASSSETRMQRIWNAAHRERVRASIDTPMRDSVHLPGSEATTVAEENAEIAHARNVLTSAVTRETIAMTSESPRLEWTYDEWQALAQASSVMKKHGLENHFRDFLSETGIVENGPVTAAEVGERLFGRTAKNSIIIENRDSGPPRRAETFSAASNRLSTEARPHYSEPPDMRNANVFFGSEGSAGTMPSPQSETFSHQRPDTIGSDISSVVDGSAEVSRPQSKIKPAKHRETSFTSMGGKSESDEKQKKGTKYGLGALFGKIERPISTAENFDSEEAAFQAAEKERRRKEREELYGDGPRWVKILGGLV